MDSAELADVLVGVARGEPAAFDCLYMSTRARLFALIHATVRDVGFAEDVLHEVYLEVWQKIHHYESGMGSPLSWLMMVSRRRAIDRVRSEEGQRRRIARAAVLFADINHGPSDEQMLLGEEYCELRGHLATLTERQRQSIELVYFADMTPQQCAAHLNVPLATFKTRLRDALVHLRTIYANGSASSVA
ncbi:sigma-70 family RNA polymerase sigma factor [Williamsia sp. DF01-3]|uniref:sigma-70 family RNA polymerase sigma factor n=1 Tax=Williamsia sp. DF01-3 TaxID=2934157 RepID=UPI001FF6C673|nr:sigma-70 family RNA polymerase sigma factor [Williamsia sp. DF01-3]MCK0515678.1 sigma-70 family RNA polymerase sigma factor [Williamsia sp. DF01-3]